ncbi:MAG: TonB-dependent receptor [Chitinophagaceae bacterium]|jgi:Fe(3+) dicitrate transport protein|nr:TonB-dependent receptor [Chitinophagaceae bacterium]
MGKLLIIFLVCFNINGIGQVNALSDTIFDGVQNLDSVLVTTRWSADKINAMPSVRGTFLYSGKKTEQIFLTGTNADVANKSARQVFAKIPGVFVYDMDGAGNQLNISMRGLDPHRGWEFSNRKDGFITNSDLYGYPASHFSMPLESIERIEIVRGTASLQYGSQFGGMINYVTKKGDTTRPFAFENIATTGSYRLLSNYTSVSGRTGRFSYFAYYQKRGRLGYRDNEQSQAEAASVQLKYAISNKFTLQLEWSRSYYLYRLSGSLTDSMFLQNPRQASRSRNYYSPDIHIPAFSACWKPSSAATVQLKVSAILGNRSSVLFDRPVNIRDSINLQTGLLNSRQVDIDIFRSYTTELNVLYAYRIGQLANTLSTGLQYINNDLGRRQFGVGTTASNYDLTIIPGSWGRDIHLLTSNLALFAENKIQLSKTFSLNTGFRIEQGTTRMRGQIVYYQANKLPLDIPNKFPLFGMHFLWKPSQRNTELYGGISQAFRPMYFRDLIPGSVFEEVDPAIKSAKGYNAEIGFRGSWRFLRWDITAYQLRYNNRFGILVKTDASNNLILWRTNIGDSRTNGLELLLQTEFALNKQTGITLFTSTAITDARYISGTARSGNQNISLKKKFVESAPILISRNGVQVQHRMIYFQLLYSYTASSYADPLNTIEPIKSTGAAGLVPAYSLLDAACSIRISKSLEIKLNINNLFDKQYFTKRPTLYPGPGVWPSDGRNFSCAITTRL